MQHKNITFIGAGNMARAMVTGMLDNAYPVKKITMSNRSPQKLNYYKALGIKTTQDNKAAVSGAEVVILAVKPYQIHEACKHISGAMTHDTLVVSIAAGITTEFIAQCLGGSHAVIRAMPNIGSEVLAGVTGIFSGEHVSAEQETFVEELFSAMSLIVSLEDEDLLSAVTAVSGSGIAYYFRIMEIMTQEAIDFGLPAEVAKVMVAQTALGAAKLALESEEDVSALRRAVVSARGTTERALHAMDTANLTAVIQGGMRAALQRSQEITEELCKW